MTQDAKPKRGRPVLTAEQHAQTRARIAEAALRLFLEEGFHSVSMRRLGKEVGLTPMALYRYYDSKLGILASLWGHVLGLAFQRVAQAADPEQAPRDRLLAISQAYVGYWLDNVDHYGLVFMSAGVSNADVKGFVAQPEVLARFQVFFDMVARSRGLPAEAEGVKRATDGLLSHLHGITHSSITMQGYPWTDAGTLVRDAVDAAAEGPGA
ncbi:Transcriptional regulator, TetR family [Candidatus Rhodobacter oscarellae]|uniref:Transcriptional regulator, TetR family n=1 Tax=Candidatus Rhodobacter oscarellae TaxID=1675527 RepID=A0A0J9ECI0_9RHOB|nr:TetR/AcrR family transcriptional regulator [Candidatus Rhodobacter lobularis]KMW60455.1 Transcriptional regulator, TetR family [Candidatus Rhodobacter lobularis]